MTKQQHLKELAIQHDTIQTDLAILEGKKKEINEQVKRLMGAETRYELAGGRYWLKYPQVRKSYDLGLTTELLGPELASGVMKVDTKKLEDLVKDMQAIDATKWVGIAATLKYEQIIESETMALRLV